MDDWKNWPNLIFDPFTKALLLGTFYANCLMVLYMQRRYIIGTVMLLLSSWAIGKNFTDTGTVIRFAMHQWEQAYPYLVDFDKWSHSNQLILGIAIFAIPISIVIWQHPTAETEPTERG